MKTTKTFLITVVQKKWFVLPRSLQMNFSLRSTFLLHRHLFTPVYNMTNTQRNFPHGVRDVARLSGGKKTFSKKLWCYKCTKGEWISYTMTTRANKRKILDEIRKNDPYADNCFQVWYEKYWYCLMFCWMRAWTSNVD